METRTRTSPQRAGTTGITWPPPSRSTGRGSSEPSGNTSIRFESATRFQRWALRTAIVFGAAALALTAALAIIALIGLVLSRFQIQSLADAHAHLAANERTAAEALVDRIYAVVLWAAAVLLFVALPVLVVGTAGLGVAVLWAIFSMPFIPLKLVALVGIGTVLALYGLIRGLFLRRPPVSGRRLSRAEEPQLYRFLDEVAKAARSKPVDQVVLQPGPGVGVREEGSTLAVLTGRGRRVLELGYGAVQHLNIGELGSVLAHEYGHFSHGETRLTPLLRRVEVTAIQMVMGMAASGRIVLLNPAFWFLRWYMRVYVRITRGHGRRRELLADRVAALTYGGETFASALTNVSEAGEDLSRAMLLLGALRTVGVDAGTPYDLQTLKREETAKVLRAALASERKGQKSDPDDSHPPDAERIARVAGIGAPAWTIARPQCISSRTPRSWPPRSRPIWSRGSPLWTPMPPALSSPRATWFTRCRRSRTPTASPSTACPRRSPCSRPRLRS